MLIQIGLQRLEDFPVPLWLALFVEGTRFTPAKLLAAQEYAAANGLHVPRNVLVPRTKVSCLCCCHEFIPCTISECFHLQKVVLKLLTLVWSGTPFHSLCNDDQLSQQYANSGPARESCTTLLL
jgi:hypothetical protein